MNETYLEHHGIIGQKWGLRRYQNENGSYTEAGKMRRYSARENYKDVSMEKQKSRSQNLKALKNNLIYEGAANTGKFAARTAAKVAASRALEKHKLALILLNPMLGLPITALNKPAVSLSIAKDFIDTTSMNLALKEIYDEELHNENNRQNTGYVRHNNMNNETYIQHWGIFGQKWGVRRYQNPDGTLTEVGKKRYGAYGPYQADLDERIRKDAWEADKKDLQLMGTKATTSGKDGKPSPAEKITNNLGTINTGMEKIARVNAPRKQASAKAKSMTDQELRDAINRMRLERDFDNLNSVYIESGYDRTMKILAVGGGVIGILGGAASIATALNTIYSAREKEN